ncbi:MAG: accessory factor associated with RNA polymerase II [Bogoriella megaspora]|nr:MAG: accessory factor associated with RNA polymerase II [Bogoriella megaspora]
MPDDVPIWMTDSESEHSKPNSLSSDFSFATSTSGSASRLTTRGKPDTRLFDDEGYPIQIRLKQKASPTPYNYQQAREQYELKSGQYGLEIRRQGELQSPTDIPAIRIAEPEPKPSQPPSHRSRQERKWRSSNQRSPTPPPHQRPGHARAASTESFRTGFSFPKVSHSHGVRRSDPVGAEAPSVQDTDPTPYQRSGSAYPLRRGSVRGNNNDLKGGGSSHGSEEGSGGQRSIATSPSISDARQLKSWGGLGRFFPGSLIPREEDDSFEGHSPSPERSPSRSKLGSYFKLHAVRRWNRSSSDEPVHQKSRKDLKESFTRRSPHNTTASEESSSLSTNTLTRAESRLQTQNFQTIRHRSPNSSPADPQELSFLTTEARRMETPPSSLSMEMRDQYFDFLGSTETYDSDNIPDAKEPAMTPGWDVDRLARRKASAMPIAPWFRVQIDESEEHQLQHEREKADDPTTTKQRTSTAKFEIDVPDHLPSSPLCPLNQRKSLGSRAICPLHGRKKAEAGAAAVDPLVILRRAIASNVEPVPTITPDASAADVEKNLAKATHLIFNFNNETPISFELSIPTRFESSGTPVDLRSIYLAWLNKDATISEYITATQQLNNDLAASGSEAVGSEVKNLIFQEKLDLIAWLEGATESEFIKPLAEDEQLRAANLEAAVARGDGDITMRDLNGASGVGGTLRKERTVDPRLQEIYNGERKMGDRNTCLRGIKPTVGLLVFQSALCSELLRLTPRRLIDLQDFSHIRKSAESFLGRSSRSKPGAPPSAITHPSPLVSNLKKPGAPNRRPEPIILLSPSASSLLRMTNIKSFLSEGVYTPPSDSSSSTNILHISRLLPSISSHPMRFILVDTPDQFKPDYWSRVVAIFTTGQAWQFKSYKWQHPAELFSHALGVYVGWRGEEIPGAVRGWGRQVVSVQVDKWNDAQGTKARWRDREVVEGVWGKIEESMRAKGWGKEAR